MNKNVQSMGKMTEVVSHLNKILNRYGDESSETEQRDGQFYGRGLESYSFRDIIPLRSIIQSFIININLSRKIINLHAKKKL